MKPCRLHPGRNIARAIPRCESKFDYFTAPPKRAQRHAELGETGDLRAPVRNKNARGACRGRDDWSIRLQLTYRVEIRLCQSEDASSAATALSVIGLMADAVLNIDAGAKAAATAPSLATRKR